jgi:predicted exporter
MRTDADPAKAKLIWPTMRLGALSTVIAYLAIAGSGSLGLAQLGCFSAIGILVTVGATRSLLPGMIERYWIPAPRFGKAPANRPTLRHQIWLIGLLVSAGLFLAAPEQIWNNNLASLTPLSPDRLSRDRELRMAFGAPDIRHLLVLRNRDQQKVLRETEEIQAFLNDLIGQGILGDSQSVTDLLPSRLTQESRIQRLRDATDLQVRLAKALQGTPFKPDAFAPFLADAHRMAATSKWVEIEDFSGTLFEQLIAQHLYFDGQSWVSLVTLYGLNEPRLLEDRLGEDLPGKTLVDLKIASQSLVENYRLRIMNVLAIAFIFITALLIWRIGIVERTFWILGTLVTSIFLTIGIIHNILGPLSLFTLIATVLVAGLGLDYGLFMSRQEESYENLRDTRHAVMTCALSTLAAFSVLALSDIPVLKSIGMTVAIGVLISITLARAGIGAKHS